MPLKLTCGFSKKIGQPHYGSLGANCSVELELDSQMLQNDLDGFFQRVEAAYAACRQAVQAELDRNVSGGNGRCARPVDPPRGLNGHAATADHGTAPKHANGDDALHQASRHDDEGEEPPPADPGITERQLAFARQLASQVRGLGFRRLESLAARLHGKPLVALSAQEASALIDTLKDLRAGSLALTPLMNEPPPDSPTAA